jgi:hypothetical protein
VNRAAVRGPEPGIGLEFAFHVQGETLAMIIIFTSANTPDGDRFSASWFRFIPHPFLSFLREASQSFTFEIKPA